MPSSRAMIAAWQVRPPRLVTIADAFFMTGSQSGSVMSVTSTSPGSHARHFAAHPSPAAPGRCRRDCRSRAPTRGSPSAPSGDSASGVSSLRVGFHRLRPRLQDIELAVDAVAAPLDVHRAAIVLLDDQGIARELLDLRVGDARSARRSASGTSQRSAPSGPPRARPRTPS